MYIVEYPLRYVVQQKTGLVGIHTWIWHEEFYCCIQILDWSVYFAGVGCLESRFFKVRMHLEICLSSGVNQHGNWCRLSLTFGMKLSIALWIELFIVAHMKSVSWLSIHSENPVGIIKCHCSLLLKSHRHIWEQCSCYGELVVIGSQK